RAERWRPDSAGHGSRSATTYNVLGCAHGEERPDDTTGMVGRYGRTGPGHDARRVADREAAARYGAPHRAGAPGGDRSITGGRCADDDRRIESGSGELAVRCGARQRLEHGGG